MLLDFEVELGVSLHMLSQLHSILVIVVMLKNNLVLLTQLMKSMKKSIEELSKRPLALRQKSPKAFLARSIRDSSVIWDVTKGDADPFPEKVQGITSRGRLDHPF